MGRRVIRRRAHDLLEHTACTLDRVPLERLQRRAPLDERTIGRQHRFDGSGAVSGRGPGDRNAEPIPAPRDGVDVRSVGCTTENPSQRGDRLFQAVVGDRDVLPGSLDQRIFGDDLAGS